MTDGIGIQVGEIHGDYVIGFRARHQGLTRSFPTLEEARAHIEQLWLERAVLGRLLSGPVAF